MQINELLERVKQVNAAIENANKQHAQAKWEYEKCLKDLNSSVESYNKDYQANLDLSNAESLKTEFTAVVESVVESTVKMEKALELNAKDDIKGIYKLLGMKQDTKGGLQGIDVDTSVLPTVSDIEKSIQARLESFDTENIIDERDALTPENQAKPEIDTQEDVVETDSVVVDTDNAVVETETEVVEKPKARKPRAKKVEVVEEVTIDVPETPELPELDLDLGLGDLDLDLNVGIVEPKATVMSKSTPKVTNDDLGLGDLDLSDLEGIGGLDKGKGVVGNKGGATVDIPLELDSDLAASMLELL